MAGSRLNTGFLGLPKNFFKKYLHFGSGQYIIHGVERQRCKTTAEEISENKNLPVLKSNRESPNETLTGAVNFKTCQTFLDKKI